jgi:hypothetical protein
MSIQEWRGVVSVFLCSELRGICALEADAAELAQQVILRVAEGIEGDERVFVEPRMLRELTTETVNRLCKEKGEGRLLDDGRKRLAEWENPRSEASQRWHDEYLRHWEVKILGEACLRCGQVPFSMFYEHRYQGKDAQTVAEQRGVAVEEVIVQSAKVMAVIRTIQGKIF